MPKLRNIQALRAVAALMVVGVHLAGPSGFERTYLQGGALFDPLHVPGSAGVDLFFVISGAVMTVGAWQTRGQAGVVGRFLRRRVARVVPLYWLVSALLVPAFLAQPALPRPDGTDPPSLLASFLLLPQDGYPLLLVGWTLVFEMWFYVLFALALSRGRRGLMYVMLPWVTVVIGLHIAVGDTTNPYLAFFANLMHVEFAMGILVGHLVLKGRLVAPRLVTAAGVLLAAAALVYAGTYTTDFPSAWYRALAVGVAAAVCVYGATALELRRGRVLPRALEKLGDASYSLYLTHLLVLAFFGQVASAIPSRSPLAHVLLLCAALAICVGTALVVYRLVERPLLRLLRTRRLPDAGAPRSDGLPARAAASA